MSLVANQRILVDADASTIAFQAGQIVERLLIEGGAEAASGAGASVVRAEHVLHCLDQRLLDQLRLQLDDWAKRGSREAA